MLESTANYIKGSRDIDVDNFPKSFGVVFLKLLLNSKNSGVVNQDVNGSEFMADFLDKVSDLERHSNITSKPEVLAIIVFKYGVQALQVFCATSTDGDLGTFFQQGLGDD